nr:hypothetical protein [Tanacetum cinerariifolium]
MDDSNLTMEEYIELEAKKGCRRGQTFNKETATDFPAIVVDDPLGTDHKISPEPRLGGLRRQMSRRQFILAMGLHTTEEMETDVIASDGDFLGPISSYTSIRDPLRRLCHQLIAFNIFGRGQAPKKVTATKLFYLRIMDKGTTADPAPVQAPQAPTAAFSTRTMPQRMAILEEEVRGVSKSLGE